MRASFLIAVSALAVAAFCGPYARLAEAKKPGGGTGNYTLVGTVTAARGNGLIVHRTGGNVKLADVQVVADDSTKIESEGKAIPPAAVGVGQKVQVKGTQFDGVTLRAVRVKVLVPEPGEKD